MQLPDWSCIHISGISRCHGSRWDQGGVPACLHAGANDLGGTLMNETISRAAGAAHGQEMPPERMEALIRAAGRRPLQRTTLYTPAATERRATSLNPVPLART